MDLKPEEISKIIKAQIKQYDQKLKQDETGTIILVGDGIARASGLESCMANELVEFENGEYGMALNLEEDSVSIVILGSDVGLHEGSIVRRTGRVEFAPGRVERIIRAFCDSPYLSQEDYADALSALIELFDTVKTETDDRISDEALIEEMRAAFDGVCHGSLELLADEVLSRVVRRVNARGGAEWKMTEDT